MFKLSIHSQTVRDIVKVLSGNIVAQGLAFLGTVLVSRDLGPASYGEFALMIAVFTFFTQLADLVVFAEKSNFHKFVTREPEALAAPRTGNQRSRCC